MTVTINSTTYIVRVLAMHARRRTGGVYRRPSHWVALAGRHTAVAHTRREALERLRDLLEAA